jgi:hypothetical protein
MARPGITREDVHRSADALLAAGERPTNERVRGALGRGSPNTIGPLLDSWWAQLAPRLQQQVAMPELPDVVRRAFAGAWAQALAAGREHAEAHVAPERAALAHALATTEAAAAAQVAALAGRDAALQQAQVMARGLEATLAQSEQRVADLQREVAAVAATAADLGQQRETAEARLLAALARADQDRAAAAVERDRLQTLLRQVEDRAYGEVDRARQDLKTLKAQMAAQTREHGAALRASEQARRAAESAGQRAQREAATLQGRVNSLTAARAKPATKLRRTKKA